MAVWLCFTQSFFGQDPAGLSGHPPAAVRTVAHILVHLSTLFLSLNFQQRNC